MIQKKLNYEAMACFEEICKVIADGFDLKDAKKPKDYFYFKELFNFTEEQISRILDVIIERIPYYIYLNENKAVNDIIPPIIAKEMVTFLSRTDPNSEYFDNDLTNFRDEIVSIVTNNTRMR